MMVCYPARMLVIGVLLAAVSTERAAEAQAALPVQAEDFRVIVQQAKEKVFPAVLYIRCLQETHEAGERKSQEISGSGVVITPDGQALTNWHVIDKATSVRCLLADGTAMEAEVLGSDKSADLALLQMSLPDGRETLPYAKFGDSDALQEGDFVMAMGAPWGLNRSVSIGIISCTRRYLPDTSEYSLWLQTDASINPGNSGGPLVNTEGEVIGLNTRGGGGMGFAVPSHTVTVLVDQLREHGQVAWSWTGLQLQALRDFNRDMYFEGTEGVIVAETDPQSPARRAGLQPRDRIMKVNGDPVSALTEEDLPAVRRTLGFLAEDVPAQFEVRRGGETLTFQITPREKGKVEGEELDCPRWDFTVKTINQFDNEDLYFYRKKGVFVFGVKYPGNALDAGLQTNDIILTIDGLSVETLDDVRQIHEEALANVKTKHRVAIVVLRNGLYRHLVLKFSRDYSKE
ncbi:MAG: trypsin-like peptidase domain-containing protein [Phycisphaerales bacterium]|nr:MAG: trypsin-like peptidase domain-containing protein [Phycisphaerales bacterium]